MPETFNERVRILLRNELPEIAGAQNAGYFAQQGNGGLGIQHIRRGVAKAALENMGSNVTVSQTTTAAALTTPLTLQMFLSGRPIRVVLTGILGAGASGALTLDVKLRGASITLNRMIYTSSGVFTHTGEEIVMAPAPGYALFEVVGFRDTSDATIYTTGPNRLVLTVVEL